MLRVHFYATAPKGTMTSAEPLWTRGVNDGEYFPIPRVGDSIEIFAGENNPPAVGVVKQINYRYSSHEVVILFDRGATDPGKETQPASVK